MGKMITFTNRGNFAKTFDFLRAQKKLTRTALEYYGQKGVEALSRATPKDTGLTSRSWYYEIVPAKGGATLQWLNSNISKYVPVAILIQYGHATGTGGWVEGVDYINPAIKPIFDELSEYVWKGTVD